MSLEELQAWTDRRLKRWMKTATCPVTGLSVWESFKAEQEYLQPLPLLPEPFDIAVTRKVHRDCTVNFEGRTYSVPYRYWGLQVEVRGGPRFVQVVFDGEVIAQHRRHTRSRIILDSDHYEEEPGSEVPAPLPLGAMGSKLQDLYEDTVEMRSVDMYAALAEVSQ